MAVMKSDVLAASDEFRRNRAAYDGRIADLHARRAAAMLPVVPACAIAFAVSAASNFLSNRTWTFAVACGRPHHQLARFLTVSLAALATDLAILSGLVELAGTGKLIAAAVAIALVTPLSFLGNKHWSFGRA